MSIDDWSYDICTQIQRQSPEKVSHLEAKQNTEKWEFFLATLFEFV